jgi:hypothetical protein
MHSFLRPIHITHARARQACARQEICLAFTCACIVVHTTSVARQASTHEDPYIYS